MKERSEKHSKYSSDGFKRLETNSVDPFFVYEDSRKELKLNKPNYPGFLILDKSKKLVCHLSYYLLQPHYGQGSSTSDDDSLNDYTKKLHFMDADSVIYNRTTETRSKLRCMKDFQKKCSFREYC